MQITDIPIPVGRSLIGETADAAVKEETIR
jgi:hypothetical protein